MTFPLDIPDPLRRRMPPGTGVLLGLSGGVDSAVTLALLRSLDCDVQCVTFKNFCYGEDTVDLTARSCCSLEAIDEARRLARSHGATHWVGDVEEPFRREVIEPFVADYAAARTPNPCLDCNGTVRFPELVRLADRQGCALAATGHYARVDFREGTARLLRGRDPAKDQSYFLHRVGRDLLPRLVFPLGRYTKDEVRHAARELGLSVAEKRDSQEICFVPDGDRSFLFGNGAGTAHGEIVDTTGQVLGRHRGLVHYTVGQRRGLGVAAPEPLYVVALEPATNRLVVGPRSAVATTFLVADDFVTLVDGLADRGREWCNGPVTARIRHRHGGTPVASWRRVGATWEIELAESVDGGAPGQGLVLYGGPGGETVLGGGRIRAARREGTGT